MASPPHAHRPDEVIVALWQTIATGGIESVSFRTLAQRAGVSVGLIQHRFTNKDDLIVAGCRTLIDVAHDAYLASKATTPRARLMHILTQQIPFDDPGRFGVSVWYAYLIKSLTHPGIAELLTSTQQDTERECIRLLRELGTSDEVACHTARHLLALSDGLTLRVVTKAITPEEAIAVLEHYCPDNHGSHRRQESNQ